jgi:glycosyltransferase involved in cell wall biosynthesis
MKPSIIIPTLGRTERLAQTVNSIYETACKRLADPPFEIVIVTEDPDTICMIKSEMGALVELIEAGGTPVEKWNLGAAHADGDWLMLMSDDVIFLPGWMEACQRTPNRGFIGLNEGVNWTDDVGHWMISRECACDVLGGVLAIPHYKSWSFDQETCAIVRRAGRYARTDDIVIDHRHYSLGKAAFDETYKRVQPWHVEDARTYVNRKAAGFPIDWAPVIAREAMHGVA